MTAKQRPIPAHGTEARYRGCASRPACRCGKCRKAGVRAATLRKVDGLQGQSRRVPAGPVWEHVLKLRAAGLNDLQIGQASELHPTGLARIGRRPTVLRSTAERILAVPLDYRPPQAQAVAIGAARRLQALCILNHSRSAMAARIGISRDFLSRIANGEYTHIRPRYDRAIRALYTELSTTRGTSERTGRYAAQQGWRGPLAWHDIDDPDATPDDGEPDQVLSRLEARQQLAASRAEDIEFLAKFGIPVNDIAERTGLDVSYVRGQLDGSRAPGWRQKQAAS